MLIMKKRRRGMHSIRLMYGAPGPTPAEREADIATRVQAFREAEQEAPPNAPTPTPPPEEDEEDIAAAETWAALHARIHALESFIEDKGLEVPE